MKCIRLLIALSVYAGLTSNAIAATFEFQGTVETATGAFVPLTPQGSPVSLVYVADDAAVAGGLVGPGDIESIDLGVGAICFSTGFSGNCPVVPNSWLPITSIEAALTYAGGIPTGGFLEFYSAPPTTALFFIDIDFTHGTFLVEVLFAGTASGSLNLVPVPAAAWLFGSASLALFGLRRTGTRWLS